jgi:DNA-binding response OmpR family regulator
MTATELDSVAREVDSFHLAPEWNRETGVLVVHPDLDTAVQIGLRLANRGYRVWTAKTGADGLWEGLAHAQTLAAVVCPPKLPDIPGTELYRRLKLTLPKLFLCMLAAAETVVAV